MFGASAALVAVIAWPALAFGGVYPWVYAVTASLVVLFALLAVTAGGWRVEKGLALAAVAVLAAVALQLLPLPTTVLARVSPAAAAFLDTHNLGYALAGLAGDRPAHPLSIDPAATRRFLLFLLTVCLLFAGVRSLGAVRPLRFLVTTVTILGTSLALIGLAQAGAGSDRMYGTWAPETAAAVFGPFVNRNHFAAFMLMALPIAMTQCAAHARNMRWQSGSTRVVELIGTPAASQALLAAFAVLVMSAALVTTRSRSGIAGFAVVLVGVLIIVAGRRRGLRQRVIAGGLVMALAVGVTSWFGWGALMARFDQLPGSRLSGRVDAWSEGLRIAAAFWPTGSGLNTYASAALAYHDPAVDLYFRTPHNDYLQVMTDGGLLVGVPLLVLIGLLVVRMVRAQRSMADSSPFDAWTRSGAVAGLAAVALQELVDFSLQTPANAVLFAALAAYVLSPPTRPGRRVRLQAEVASGFSRT